MYSDEDIKKYIKEINEIILEKPSAYSAILKNSKNKHLFTFINDMTPKLNDEFYSLSTKI